eukprot:5922515-Lingulodinium_polyedra.AAC.1
MIASQLADNFGELRAWLGPALMPEPPAIEEFESDGEPEDGLATAKAPPKPAVIAPEVGTSSV